MGSFCYIFYYLLFCYSTSHVYAEIYSFSKLLMQNLYIGFGLVSLRLFQWYKEIFVLFLRNHVPCVL